MSIIEWDGTLAIGHAKIDEQHKSLVGLINRLHAAQANPAGQGDIKLILMELYKYTLYHFNEEETLMGQIAYAHRQAHMLEHQRFVDRLDVLAAKAKAGDAPIQGEVFNWLIAWLLDHISVTDKQLVAALGKA